MSIAGRSLSRMSIDELMTFRDRYKAEYLKEVKIQELKTTEGQAIPLRLILVVLLAQHPRATHNGMV